MEQYHCIQSSGKIYKTTRGVNNEIKRAGHGKKVTTLTFYDSGKITSKTGVYGRKSKTKK